MEVDTALPLCLFTTFGMFIIDEIEWPDNKHPTQTNLIGGAGTYASLGCRLALSPAILHNPTLPESVSWIVDTGTDFPPSCIAAINSWRTNCIFRNDPTRLTTRAWNGYGPGDFRAFKYVTPKRRLEVSDLDRRQLQAQSFHMVCSAERCRTLVGELSEARTHLSQETKPDSPVIIWEPIPDLCTPEELIKVRNAAANCTVISPNHDELRTFFEPHEAEQSSQEELVLKLMGWNCPSEDTSLDPSTDNINGVHRPFFSNIQTPICIIREGANGSTAYLRISGSSTHTSIPQVLSIHLPAFHTAQASARVIDPTGGGNTYLGALAIALTRPFHDKLPTAVSSYFDAVKINHLDAPLPSTDHTRALNEQAKRIVIAMTTATIAASFAIEQFGVPQLDDKAPNTDELWNGQTVTARLGEYLSREHMDQDFLLHSVNTP